MAASDGKLLNAVATLSRSALAFATALFDEIRWRVAPRDLTRLSDHLLADLGLERDWDGSIVPIDRDQRGRW
jgi:uncharacterized protein YjiS (DUF1127 family)